MTVVLVVEDSNVDDRRAAALLGAADGLVVRHARTLAEAAGAIDGVDVVLVSMAPEALERGAADALGWRRAERDLANLHTAIEASDDMVVITDRSGVIEYVNAAFERVTGYSRDEAIGQTPRLLRSGEHDAGEYAEMWRTILAGRTYRTDFVNRRRDGRLYRQAGTITPVRDEAGQIAHFIQTARDVTEAHQLEEQLRQSQKMEAVGRLAGGIAHDFNNILTAILGHAEFALSDLPPGEVRGDVEEIIRAGRRASDLTRQLLAFSRKQVLQPQVLDLSAVVSACHPMLRRLIGEDVDLEFVGQEACVRADPGQIEQIVLNLVVNARDALPRGGRIVVRTGPVDLVRIPVGLLGDLAPGRHVCLAVADDGVGMDAETRSRIFEPFFSTKGKDGTGLGLATVFGIVQQSGGGIDLTTHPGQGTRFDVYFPRVDRETERRELPVAAGRPAGRSGTILVVEDEESVRRLVVRILRRAGYEVAEAGDGAAGLEAFGAAGRPFDLVVTDVVMPGMSGVEMVERLRLSSPRVRVLFSSGYSEQALGRHLEVDADAALVRKPFEPVDFLRKVEEVLGT